MWLDVTLWCANGCSSSRPIPWNTPDNAKKPVVDEYHGVKVTDDYRWLENWDDPDVRAWSDAQNQYARAYLDGLAIREPIKKWLRETANATSVSYFSIRSRGDSFFAMKTQPPKNQPFLISLKSLDDPASERVILDPNQLNAKGTTAIDFYVPSLDGRYVAVSLSEGGSEEGTVHVYDVANGKETGDVIPRVNKGTGGGSVAWIGEGTGFFYTRYPADGERPKEDADYYQQIYFSQTRALVTSDSYSAGKDFLASRKLSCTRLKMGDTYSLKWLMATEASSPITSWTLSLGSLKRGRR